MFCFYLSIYVLLCLKVLYFAYGSFARPVFSADLRPCLASALGQGRGEVVRSKGTLQKRSHWMCLQPLDTCLYLYLYLYLYLSLSLSLSIYIYIYVYVYIYIYIYIYIVLDRETSGIPSGAMAPNPGMTELAARRE